MPVLYMRFVWARLAQRLSRAFHRWVLRRERIETEILYGCGCLVQQVRQADGRYAVRAWSCSDEHHELIGDVLANSS